ncbi:MAG: hypothetical protein M5R36_16930 [Deltaproteobacteria bacterium]|nr:hypothetical protein [Deltaproteobacteria bacterium]
MDVVGHQAKAEDGDAVAAPFLFEDFEVETAVVIDEKKTSWRLLPRCVTWCGRPGSAMRATRGVGKDYEKKAYRSINRRLSPISSFQFNELASRIATIVNFVEFGHIHLGFGLQFIIIPYEGFSWGRDNAKKNAWLFVLSACLMALALFPGCDFEDDENGDDYNSANSTGDALADSRPSAGLNARQHPAAPNDNNHFGTDQSLKNPDEDEYDSSAAMDSLDETTICGIDLEQIENAINQKGLNWRVTDRF